MKKHWLIIKVYAGQYPTSDMIAFKKWEWLPWEVRCKWDWYFKYRAALFQVQYPKSLVTVHSGQHEKTKEQIDSDAIKFKIAAKRAAITKTENLIKQSENEWNARNELFPITEYGPYKKAMAKLEMLKQELTELTKV